MPLKRAIQALLVTIATVPAWFLPLEPASADEPEFSVLPTWLNNAMADFPGAVEFTLLFGRSFNPQRIDLELVIEPEYSCVGETVHTVRLPANATTSWQWELDLDEPFPPGHLVRWRLELDRNAPIPPGETVHWRWKVTGTDGSVYESRQRAFTWADDRFDWRTYAKDGLAVHWYGQYPEFGEHLVGYLEPQLELIEALGTLPSPVNVFMYENAEDAGSGVLLKRDFANPYREFNSVVSVTPKDIEGDELAALIHELAHFVVQDKAFNCFGGLPFWLEEGLAMLAEGGLSDDLRIAFAEARLIEQFVPLRSFDVPLSTDERDASIRFAQSYDLVEFLTSEFGWESISRLLELFKYGIRVDDALKAVFGTGIEETELLWRKSRGLPDLAPSRLAPTPSDGGG